MSPDELLQRGILLSRKTYGVIATSEGQAEWSVSNAETIGIAAVFKKIVENCEGVLGVV